MVKPSDGIAFVEYGLVHCLDLFRCWPGHIRIGYYRHFSNIDRAATKYCALKGCYKPKYHYHYGPSIENGPVPITLLIRYVRGLA